MKALPKRKGNDILVLALLREDVASMKALPKRKGNLEKYAQPPPNSHVASMKALPKRKGNADPAFLNTLRGGASMKALPKRKGNTGHVAPAVDKHLPQ